MNEANKAREWLLLGGLLLLAFAFRLGLTSVDRVVWGDEVMYAEAGRNLFSGKGFTYAGRPETHHAPLFSIALGLFSLFGGGPETPGNIAFVLFGTLYLVPVYLLARKLVGLTPARISLLILALLPALTSFLYFSPSMSAQMYLLTVFGFLYLCFLCLERYNLALYAAAGGTAGVAYITRPEALAYFGLFFMAFFVQKLWSQRLSWGKVIKSIVLYVACFAVIAAPYVLFLRAHTGRWLLSGKGGIAYSHMRVVSSKGWAVGDRWIWGFDSAGTEVRGLSDERFEYSMLRDVVSEPVEFGKRVAKNARSLERLLLTNYKFFSPILMILLVVGLLHEPWSRQRAAKEGFLLLCAVPNSIYLAFMVEVRFLAVLFPVLVLWASCGVTVCQRWLVETLENLFKKRLSGAGQRLATLAPVALTLTAISLGHLPTIRQYKAELPYEYKEVGAWMKSNLPADAGVMSRNETPPFYGEKRWVAFPNSSCKEAIWYARTHGAEYVLVDERVVRKYRPQYIPLIEGEPPAELEPVKSWAFPNGRMLVFRVLPA